MGNWTWLDSSAYNWSNWATEPSSMGDDYCAVVSSGEQWEAVKCDDSYYYICEMNGECISLRSYLLS